MVGVDIVEVKRIKKLIKDKKFINRVFTENEVKYCEKKKKKALSYAARFAAKEAVYKALGGGTTYKHIEILTINKKPIVKIKNIKKKISVSISHTDEYAVAVAIVND
ncbi:MAG: holo-ACP synthase [bacterium]|nr:holo-ACP synthase [bacterium]